MKGRLKLLIATTAMLISLFVAATSAYGCWILVIHQRECPKALIQKD